MTHPRLPAPLPDAFAAFLGAAVERTGPGAATARLLLDERHANPHGTAHGTVLFSVCGIALAAAANDEETSGVVSAVTIDYLAPARPGDALVATAELLERTAREDLYAVRLVREGDGAVVARTHGRATRRSRTA